MIVSPRIKLTPCDSTMDADLGLASFDKKGQSSPASLLKLIFVSRLPSYSLTISHNGIGDEQGGLQPPSREPEEDLPPERLDRCPPKSAHEHLAAWRVKKAKELMVDLMIQGCSIEEIANECAISRSHFSRAFKNATGLPPHDWLRREKMRRAEELLRTKRLPISRVAQECGFTDQSYFTRVFRQSNGVSPRQWQMQHCSVIANEEQLDPR